MAIRNHVNLLLLLFLLGAQFSLAQHAAVHFLEHGHSFSENQQNDAAPDVAELCQICVFAKGFSYVIMPAGSALYNDFSDIAFRVSLSHNPVHELLVAGYHTRDPPFFLI